MKRGDGQKRLGCSELALRRPGWRRRVGKPVEELLDHGGTVLDGRSPGGIQTVGNVLVR